MNVSSRKFDSNLGFSVLSPEEVSLIHQATLSVLEKTGVEVLEEEALSLTEAGRCCLPGYESAHTR